MSKVINIFFALLIILIVSCNKNKDNYSCTFTSPQDGQEFYENEDISVSIATNDLGSNTVLLFVDNKCYTGSSDFPCNFTIKAGNLRTGMRKISAIAQNSEGKQSESSVIITVKFANDESPDFVSFFDEKLPVGWKTNGWYISPSYAYDDQFYIYTKADNATVTAIKTCSSTNFYLKGLGCIFFYMDNFLVERIFIGNWNPSSSIPQKWKKYEYDFPEGLHVFSWKYFSVGEYNAYAGLDAISFH